MTEFFLNKKGVEILWSKIKNKFALKTDLSLKATDKDVVHKSGAEEINGTKTFKSALEIKYTNPHIKSITTYYTKGTRPNGIVNQGILFYDDPSSKTENPVIGGFELSSSPSGYNYAKITSSNLVGTSDKTYSMYLGVPNSSIYDVNFYPSVDNAINLGTTSSKFKDVNTYLLNGKVPAYKEDIVNFELTESELDEIFNS